MTDDAREKALAQIREATHKIVESDWQVKLSFVKVWLRVKPTIEAAYAVCSAVPEDRTPQWLADARLSLLTRCKVASACFDADRLELAAKLAAVIVERGSPLIPRAKLN